MSTYVHHHGRTGDPVPKEQPPPETLRLQDHGVNKLWREMFNIRRRDSDLRQKDRGGIKPRASRREVIDAGVSGKTLKETG